MSLKTLDFFSSSAEFVIGGLLLLLIAWVVYRVGPVALERWFG